MKVGRRVLLKAITAIPFIGDIFKRRQEAYLLPQRKPYVPGAEKWQRGEEKFFTTSCGQCIVNCGIIARVVEGRVVEIKGNPNSPLTRGGIGPKGRSGNFALYSPTRIKKPRLEGNEVDWETAINALVEKIKGRGEEVLVFAGRPKGLMRELFFLLSEEIKAQFFDYWDKPFSGWNILKATYDTFGVPVIPGYDAENTGYILSLASIFETNCHGIFFSRASFKMKRGRPIHRAKIVQVDAYQSKTSIVADDWIKINPGTQNLFLGLVLDVLTKKLKKYDGLVNLPPNAEDLVGVSREKVEVLVEEMLDSMPAVCVVDELSTFGSTGYETAKLSLLINILLDNINKPGGMVVKPLHPDDIKLEEKIWMAKKGRDPKKAKIFIFYYFNPLLWRNWSEILKGAEFIVSFSPFEEETTKIANLVLPDHTFLERYEDAPNLSYEYIGVRKPIVEPLFDTMHSGDVVLKVMEKLGKPLKPKFKELLEERMEKLGGDPKEVFKNGFLYEERWKEFKPQVKVGGIDVKVPEWIGDEKEYPLKLVYQKPINYAEGGPKIPHLIELGGLSEGLDGVDGWKTFIKISPQTASELNLKNFDKVEVISPFDKITAYVFVRDEVPPYCAVFPFPVFEREKRRIFEENFVRVAIRKLKI